MNNEKREIKIPEASFTFDTNLINLDEILPETEPRYDVTVTIIEKRIWWKPWTWRHRTHERTLENVTIVSFETTFEDETP